MVQSLVPLSVVLPLAVAALLLIFAHMWPRHVPDVLATFTAAATAAMFAFMLPRLGTPITYWFGGWQPANGLVLGIDFVVDRFGAAFGLLVSVLFAATFVFAWGYFEKNHAHFHVLMLLFMAGMLGFTLTHDLFNMFVWFEVMGVAGFALTGYRLEASALEGGLNFTVMNGIGGYLMLCGIGLIYTRAGALDFSAVARVVAAQPGDVVFAGAFCLVVTALLIKAAVVPFQFWLSDAHAVAPSPVSVIFSGAMVSVAVYGIARVYWQVFSGDTSIRPAVHDVLLATGVASTLIGGVMCARQRHIKRLLAFSTISHVGIMLMAVAVLSRDGTAGMMLYLLGHGLIKGALFMIAGILLAIYQSPDELGLRGKGKSIWPAGIAMALGGLLLGGAPIGIMDVGTRMIDGASSRSGVGWIIAVITAGSALTGGAVLRVCGRVFLGLGRIPGEEERGPTEHDEETSERSLWIMLAPCVALLILALSKGTAIGHFIADAAGTFIGQNNGAAPNQQAYLPEPHPLAPWLASAMALALAALDLGRSHLPRAALNITGAATRVFRPLDIAHSGLIGDYVAWAVVGLGLFAVALAFA